MKAHLCSVGVSIFLIFSLHGSQKSTLFRSALDHLDEFEPVQVGQPGRFVEGFWWFAAMFSDDLKAGESCGDELICKVADLDHEINQYEEMQRVCREELHDQTQKTFDGEATKVNSLRYVL